MGKNRSQKYHIKAPVLIGEDKLRRSHAAGRVILFVEHIDFAETEVWIPGRDIVPRPGNACIPDAPA